jgi:hypothetical protein
MSQPSLFYETWEEFLADKTEDEEDFEEDEEHEAEGDEDNKPKLNLLDLPAEILNQIYDYVFQGCFVANGHFRLWLEQSLERHTVRNTDQVQDVEMRPVVYAELDTFLLQPGKELYTALNSWEARLRNDNLPLVIRKELKTRVFKHTAATSLLFVCRKTHVEFSYLLYSKSVFAFGSFSAISHLFEAAKPAKGPGLPRRMPIASHNLQYIRRICLDCRPRGMAHDAAAEFQLWRYYQQWEESCKVIATNLSGLEHIDLFIEIPKVPTPRIMHEFKKLSLLSLEQMWAEAFLPLKDCVSLKTVTVHLRTDRIPARWVSTETLDAFSAYFKSILLGHEKKVAAAEVVSRYRTCVTEHPHDVGIISPIDMAMGWERLAVWNNIDLNE